ncbi:EamA family transporter [Paenibacillus sp. HN-1]|uniref:DMT family transporter n=1 Tax=Paenibacillus TaxID=44249 RepID=UPI001CA947FF|nr:MULTISPECIES: EamA family transporter [Paenibacillus]MBY9081295.1 EamA family transporter [Paenibacillus sp. CGMCC 1.18879]MBY9087568.1 EamA family transporter [Paenibacillus sinensis]
MKEHSRKGLLFVSAGAICWGVSGTAANKLFTLGTIDVNGLVEVRLLVAGLLLLAIQSLRPRRRQILEIWRDGGSALRLIVFGLIGMLGVQYTYMASIRHGNAAVATLLQYLAPVMIIVYALVRRLARLTGRDLLTVLLALGGTFLLLTGGSLSGLAVSSSAVIWGVLSGMAVAFYTLYAVTLLERYDSLVVVGWAMLIGGLALTPFHPPWKMNLLHMPKESWLILSFIILFGTMIAFWFYIESLNSLSPKETSLLGCLEPLSAVVTTVFWLKTPFGAFQWLGAAFIIGMIVILAIGGSQSSGQESNRAA